MIFDGIQLTEGSHISNMNIESGTQFPTPATTGEFFYRSDESKLYIYNGTVWEPSATGAGGTGTTYTSGFGIDITAGVISSTIKSSGPVGAFRVQIGDGGGNFASIPDGSTGQVLTSNGANVPTWESLATPASASIYDIVLSIEGTATGSAVVLSFIANRSFTLAANFAGSYAVAGTAATAITVFVINKNGTSIGTVTFTGTSGTFSGTATTFVAGDLLTVVAPATPDTTLANVGITLGGTLVL